MKVGIIGAGNIGGTLAALIAGAGYEVIISYSRSAEKLKKLADGLGPLVTVGSIREAVELTDITILSIRFSVLNQVIKQMGPIQGKLIVDTNNPYDIKLPEGTSAASEVLRRMPGVKLVKAFNTLYFELLREKAFHKPLYVLPVSGDDEQAKAKVAALIHAIGFEAFNLGEIANAWQQEPNGPFYNITLTHAEATSLLARQPIR